MRLGIELHALAVRLMQWDHQRIQAREAEGFDCTAYKARQTRASAALNTDPVEWTEETRMHMMVLLEATRAPAEIKEANVGVLKQPMWILSPYEIRLYCRFAETIGVFERLQETYPALWKEEGVHA